MLTYSEEGVKSFNNAMEMVYVTVGKDLFVLASIFLIIFIPCGWIRYVLTTFNYLVSEQLTVKEESYEEFYTFTMSQDS